MFIGSKFQFAIKIFSAKILLKNISKNFFEVTIPESFQRQNLVRRPKILIKNYKNHHLTQILRNFLQNRNP